MRKGGGICRSAGGADAGVQDACETAWNRHQKKRRARKVNQIGQACREHRFRAVLELVMEDYPSWKEPPIELPLDKDDDGFLNLPLKEEIARQFLTFGPDKKLKAGFPSIFRAIQDDNIGMICLLIHRQDNTIHGIKPTASSYWFDKSTSKSLTPLVQASALGRSDAVRLLLEAGANADELAQMRFSDNSSAVITPLVATVAWGLGNSYETTKILVEEGGADVNAMSLFRDKKDDNSDFHEDIVLPLGAASNHGRYNAAKLLIKNGASVHLSRPDSFPPLHLASYSGHDKLVELLLRNGADVNLLASSSMDDTGSVTPFFLAAEGGHLSTVRKLLKAGANINKERSDGTTPLSMAVMRGNGDIAMHLIKSGADVQYADSLGWTVLHVAVVYSRKRIARAVLRKGLSPNITTNAQDSPLMLISYAKAGDDYMKLARLLLRAGASIDQENERGVTPLVSASFGGLADLVELLLSYGANANHTDLEGGFSALHYSAYHGYAEVVEVLLRHGACLDCGAKNNATALHLACEQGNDGVVKVLLDNSASMRQSSSNGMSPLHAVASFTNNTNTTRLLLEKANASADILDHTDMFGKTALHHASYRGLLEMARVLLEYGCDPNVVDSDRWTALKTAKFYKHRELEQLILSHGGVDSWSKTDLLQVLCFSVACALGYGYRRWVSRRQRH